MTTLKIEQLKKARETERVQDEENIKKIQKYMESENLPANYSLHRKENRSDSQEQVEQKIRENLAKFYLKKTQADMEKM